MASEKQKEIGFKNKTLLQDVYCWVKETVMYRYKQINSMMHWFNTLACELRQFFLVSPICQKIGFWHMVVTMATENTTVVKNHPVLVVIMRYINNTI